jgi:hypothetical protein
MPRTTKLLTFLAAAIAPCAIAAAVPASAADEVFAPTAQVTIPGAPMGSWDISFVDFTRGQFFLGDRTHKAVDVVDTGTNTFVTFIADPGQPFAGVVTSAACKARTGGAPGVSPGANDCNGPNGVITTKNGELWVSDGNSTVKVFDLTKPGNPLIATIPTGGVFRGDEVCYNPEQQQVMVANNSQADHNSLTNTNGPFATIISVKSKAIVATIPFDGSKGGPVATNGAEQCSYSRRTERFYITLPGVNNPDDGTGAVVVINPEDLDDKKLIEKTFNYANTDCDTPQGTAVGPSFQMMVGCNGSAASTNSIVIDQRNGAILAKIANESGPDMVWYNPGDGQYFLARSSAAAATQLLGVVDARGLQADTSVYTANKPNPPASSSHSVAADPVKNQVYVAIGGNGSSTVCGSVVPASQQAAANAQGCIAVYTTPKDDQCLAEGAPVRTANAGEDPVFMNGKCRDNDRHDHDHDHDDDR